MLDSVLLLQFLVFNQYVVTNNFLVEFLLQYFKHMSIVTNSF